MPAASRKPALSIKAVEVAPRDEHQIAVRVIGEMGDPRRVPRRTMLVVPFQGRRHRFPQVNEPQRRTPGNREWWARFVIPAWLESELSAGLVMVGDLTVELPPTHRGVKETGPPREPSEPAATTVPVRVLDGEAAVGEPGAVAKLTRALLGELKALDGTLAKWEREASGIPS